VRQNSELVIVCLKEQNCYKVCLWRATFSGTYHEQQERQLRNMNQIAVRRVSLI